MSVFGSWLSLGGYLLLAGLALWAERAVIRVLFNDGGSE